MRIKVHFYNLKTGIIVPNALVASTSKVEQLLELNTPPGCAPVQGVTNPFSQRVDVGTGQLVDYQPPAPDDDHEWNEDRKRWRLKPEIADQRQRQAQAQARIAELELRQQRPLRELYIDPNNAGARRCLEAIEAEISELRAAL